MDRAAGLGDQRIGRLHVIAAGRTVPDRLIEDDRGAERIGKPGDGVGDPDAAQPLVGEAAALGVDDDASRGEVVGVIGLR